VVKTELGNDGLLGFLRSSSGSFGLGSLQKSLFFLDFGLRLILGQQFEKSSGLFFRKSVGELVNGRGNLQSSKKNSLLSLE